MNRLCFRVIDGELAICQLDPGVSTPVWAGVGSFTSVTRSARELSIVCDVRSVPEGVRCERGWAILELDGPFPFEMTGVLASFIAPLAAAAISIFAVSTFDTDVVLVKREALDMALAMLAEAGHERIP